MKKNLDVAEAVDTEVTDVQQEAVVSESPAPAKKAPKFSVERLAEDCRELFGVPLHGFIGAFNSQPEDAEYTIAEAREIINKWNKKEVH